MNRETWALIKRNKNFNVHVYRRGLTVLIASLILSCIMVLIVFFLYLNEPERDFYATSGITPPVALKPMLTPNNSSSALLAPDPVDDNEERTIPQ